MNSPLKNILIIGIMNAMTERLGLTLDCGDRGDRVLIAAGHILSHDWNDTGRVLSIGVDELVRQLDRALDSCEGIDECLALPTMTAKIDWLIDVGVLMEFSNYRVDERYSIVTIDGRLVICDHVDADGIYELTPGNLTLILY